MTWHPGTGWGVIALGNLRYAGVGLATTEALRELVQGGHATHRTVRPAPVVERFRDMADGLLAGWDDAVAEEAFAMNMDLDEARDRRRAAVAAVSDALGAFRRDAERADVSTSSAHLRWWVRGERGWAELEILVTPEPAPRVQALKVTFVGDPSPELAAAAQRLLAAAAEPAPAWPTDLERGRALDVAAVERAMRAGSARFGAMRLARPIAGDGRAATTWELATDRGCATLRVALDPESGAVTEASLQAARREPPPTAW